MFNYLDPSVRKTIIEEILNSEENKLRKNESLMKYEIYKGRQYPFVSQKILQELGVKAAAQSRVISSINLTKKIIDEQARIYMREPEREFDDLNEAQLEHVDKIYSEGKANSKFKKLNRIFKLNMQGALQVVPKDGKIDFRPLYPHQYDVIPKVHDPEKADCYVISSYDKSNLFNTMLNFSSQSSDPVNNQGYFNDGMNQKIGDPDDYAGSTLYYWWTDEYNFITDKNGNYVDKEGNLLAQVTIDDVKNPIGKMPFVDVAVDKDFEFFVRGGNSVTDFSLDFSLMLSDVAEVNRLQGFAQAILSSKEQPKDIRIGPRNYLWLRLDPNDLEATRPSFSFASPNADLASSLQMLSNYASMFLTSIGQSPSLISGNGTNQQTYTSGIHKFLSMLEKFEQSQDDIDLFKWVESQAYELVKLWNNLLYNATENGFIPELSGVSLPEDSEVGVKYVGPSMDLTEGEKLAVIEKRLDLGLIDKVEAVMIDRQVTKQMAEEIVKEMDMLDELEPALEEKENESENNDEDEVNGEA